MGKEISVLFLDDEENILNSLKRVFMYEAYGIATTTNAQEASEIIRREKIKVAISDQRMPNISGVEFLKSVKEQQPDITRILFSGYADFQAAEDAINEAQIYRFINKPWNDEELKGTVQQAINRYNLIEENRALNVQIKKQNAELLQLNERLQNMYETQKAFSSTVSHELRTPLSSIKTAIDIILSESAGPVQAEQVNFLNKAKSNVDRLNRLINDILDLSKLESGKMPLRFHANDLNAVITEVAGLQKTVAEKKGLYLKTQLDAKTPPINCDLDKMHQVLNNLLNNAIKFTEQGGVMVSSSCDMQKNYVSVTVKDTGLGIKKEDTPRLFQKFEQMGSPLSNVGGTGLGLAICKEIITQHRGKIWAESEFGKGSQFCFIIPIQERREVKPQ